MPEKFADNSNRMQLGFGITFPELYEREGLIRLDRAFLAYLGEADRALADRLIASRTNAPAAAAESQLLIALAPHAEDFIAKLFSGLRFKPAPPFVAALELFVADPRKTAAFMAGAGVPHRMAADGAAEVPPEEACGVVLRFTSAR